MSSPLSSFQKILVVLIFSTITFFGLFRLTESPPFGFDEGWAVQVATNLSQVHLDGLQFSPGNIEHVSVLTSVGYPLLYTLAFWFKLFGVGIFQARLMMVVFMLGLALTSFSLLRRLYGNIMALSALAILATFPPFYTFGKEVIGEVPLLFFLTLSLLGFHLSAENPDRKRFWLFLTGIAAGLCIVTKTMALVFIPVLVVGALIALKKGRVSWRDIGVVALGTIMPIAVWLLANFQSGDSVASALDYYSNPSALTDKTATFFQNLRLFFSGGGALFMLSLMTFWVSGVVIRLKTKKKIHLEESVALLFALVIMLSLLFRYWDARYLFPVQVLGIVFAPYSLLNVFKKNKLFLCGVTVLCLANLYQLSFNSYIADSYKSTTTKDLSDYFSSVPESTSVLFYNTANVVPFFGGRNYYQRIAMFKKWVLGSDYLPLVKEAKVEMLVLGPPMLEVDQKFPLDKYLEVAKFREIRIFKKKENGKI